MGQETPPISPGCIGRALPLQTLISSCEEQLQTLQARVRNWHESWAAGLHQALREGSDFADSAVVTISTLRADPDCAVNEKESLVNRGHEREVRWVDQLAQPRKRLLALLSGSFHGARRSQKRGTYRISVHDHLEGDKRAYAQPFAFAHLPFASIHSPDTLGPPLSGIPSASWRVQGASCRHAMTPALQLVEGVKQAGIGALSLLLRGSQSAVLPEPQVKLSQWEPFQGDTVAVLVTVPKPRGLIDHTHLAIRRQFPALGPLVTVAVEKKDVPAFPKGEDGTWRALIPTTPLDKSGTRDLQVLVRDGRHSPYDRVIYLKNRDYIIENIQLPERKAGLIGGATTKELAAMGALRRIQTPQQLWSGPFLRPSPGQVTTDYGVQRYYNGRFAEGYYHRGVDYGAEEGSPVVSPAGARVVLVGQEDDGFRLHGNCIGLDHGQGVVSTMLHLQSVRVKEGDIVKAGEVVGTVGETGIATGPHLHWGLYVNGECVDPEPWMRPHFWL